jgi:hypothetical protein
MRSVTCLMENESIIKKAYNTFSVFSKPKYCTVRGDDCLDCSDHNDTLYHITRESLSIEMIGPVSWSPLSSLNSEAMAYFLPRLIEFSVCNVDDRDGDPYAVRFIHSVLKGPDHDQFILLNREQRKVLYNTLLFIKEKYADIVEFECWGEELKKAITRWKNPSHLFRQGRAAPAVKLRVSRLVL